MNRDLREVDSNYLEIFLNDVAIGAIARGINILIINESTYTVTNTLVYDTIVVENGVTITADIAALSPG